MNKVHSDLKAVPLVEVSRGDIVERIHFGHIAVIDVSKDIIYSKGDPYKYTYMRSCAKPIQVLPLLKSGAARFLDFTDKEISIYQPLKNCRSWALSSSFLLWPEDRIGSKLWVPLLRV
ncbi:MAG: asparaginase [Deltaproteobacteria bacterium]|uniref:asparaginase n=1 Tax=Desulfobacula sp. TaxID=2593537 RepID=UPI0019AE80EB|nr:asparaginase [Candidatus Desulfobacula maris]MBL6992698.1 asparaginase [Desulfobacula sp.]